MNRAVVIKATRDSLPLFLTMTGAIVGLEILLVGVIGEFSDELNHMWVQMRLFQRLIGMVLGARLAGDITATVFMTIGFAHPLMFTFTWIFLLTTCTRVTAAEIDRGTADLLLTLPVSRMSVYASVSVVWVAAGVPISLAVVFGQWIGQSVFPLWEPLDLARLSILIPNLFALYLAIGSATMFASSLVSRRGPAIAVVLAGLLLSYLLNFLGQFWTAAEGIRLLGLLHYYRPLPVVRTGDWPVGDIIILLSLAALFWTAGLWRFCRRDIPAV